ncbi:Nucleoside phosphatase GDA1/CD39 [Macleaya cordata]|uniref:Nucleoside phosphatase GDA1/CD39 n=1 Tax=Macleaya cordata TaxID=56857 RepID=A0A200QTF6_MACCD|nr:Nucleoside phosphatase GDA1/CD39 [Macleaya cordata]
MDFSNLQSRVSNAYIPPHRTQLHPRMHSFSPFPKPSQISSSQSREKWWTLGAALLIVPFLFYLFAIAKGIHQSSKFDESKPKGFGIIIDAGNTGSRIHVFEFLNEGRIPFVGFDGKGSKSLKVRPALVEFADDPDNAGSSISRLLGFAKKKVPKAEWKDTKVWLMASEGLRGVGLDASKAILESCRRVLRSSGFLFKNEWASILTGQDEGVYAWVAANYALGTLGGDPQETTGIIELGGPSVQVTFALRAPPPLEFSRMIKLAGVTYNLYAQSTIHLGQVIHFLFAKYAASGSLKGIVSPCIPKGYRQTLSPAVALNASAMEFLAPDSVGNFSACRSKAVALLQKGTDKCLHPPCKIVSSFLPELRGNPVHPDKLFYTSEFFGLVPKASMAELEAAGRHYCEDDWEKLKDEHQGIDELDLLRYCFSSAYIVALLHDGLGIPMNDKRIGFANQAGSIPLDWTLGAFIYQSVVDPQSESEPESLGGIIGNDSVTYFSLFAVLLFAVLAAFYVSKWRKPQLKTVYDLEKGHYIVTRVPR